MKLELSVAKIEDIAGVLELHYKYQIDSISPNDKKDGFITTAFTEAHLVELINKEAGLFVAKRNEVIVAYAMAASWEYWSVWPMFSHMIKDLPNLVFNGQKLNTENSYQYGPVCVDKSVRGQGVFEEIFCFALQKMSHRYPILVTFINKINPRSYAAHVHKAGLKVISEFEFKNNNYYELACETKTA